MREVHSGNMSNICITLVAFLSGFEVITGETIHYNTVKQLISALFENYDQRVRPVVNQNDTTYVNLTLYISQLDNLDLKRQTLKWAGWIEAKWYDELLTWNASQYDGRDFIMVPQSMLWKPDYVVNNDVADRSSLGSPDTPVHVSSKGLVVWEPAVTSETSCKVDIRKYPFDEQVCDFEILPWTSTSREITAIIDNQTIDFGRFISHGEFVVTKNYGRVFRYDSPSRDDVLMPVVFFIHLRRQHAFYWMSMLFPMVTFPLLCPISFLLPADCGEKMTMSITVVLSYLIFIGSLSDEMPKLSDTASLLVLYSAIQLAIGMLTVVANGIIICLFKMSPGCCKTSSQSSKMEPAKSTPQSQNKTHDASSHLHFVYSIFKFPKECSEDEDRTNRNSCPESASNICWIGITRKLDKICLVCFMCAELLTTIIFGVLLL